MKKIKVAILADMPFEALGGKAKGRGGGHAATWLPQLADRFSNEPDLDIHWVTLDPAVKEPVVHQDYGQTFHRLPKARVSLGLAMRYLPYRRVLRRVLEKIRPHVVHAWGSERMYPCVLRNVPCPSILSMQGILTEYRRIGTLPAGWQWKIMAANEQRWINDADVVTSESLWGLNHVQNIAPKKEKRMIEYGVHPSFYEIEWQPDPANPILLFCGSIDERKGVDLLVNALEATKNRRWTCKIAGSGPLLKALKERNVPGVEWLGNIAWKELQRELSRAWCLVLPTLADTSPNVVKEARVVGLPVITTETGGQAGYISHGENGFLVNPTATSEFAETMDRMMADFELVGKMGRTHLERDRKYFESQRTASAFVDLYRELHQRETQP